MPKYKVSQSYHSTRTGQSTTVFAFDKGDTVELDRADAEWVNRDAPGTLALASRAATDPAAAKKPAAAVKKPRKGKQAGGSRQAG